MGFTMLPVMRGPGIVPPAVTNDRLKPSGWRNALTIGKSATGPIAAKEPPMGASRRRAVAEIIRRMKTERLV